MSREVLKKSKNAASALNVLGGVVGLLENGTTAGWDKTAYKIIAICKKEQLRQLKVMDAADAKLGFPYPGRSTYAKEGGA